MARDSAFWVTLRGGPLDGRMVRVRSDEVSVELGSPLTPDRLHVYSRGPDGLWRHELTRVSLTAAAPPPSHVPLDRHVRYWLRRGVERFVFCVVVPFVLLVIYFVIMGLLGEKP